MARETETAAAAIGAASERAAQFYEDSPGLSGAATMIDLYYTVAALARIVEAHSKLLSALVPDKSDDV